MKKKTLKMSRNKLIFKNNGSFIGYIKKKKEKNIIKTEHDSYSMDSPSPTFKLKKSNFHPNDKIITGKIYLLDTISESLEDDINERCEVNINNDEDFKEKNKFFQNIHIFKQKKLSELDLKKKIKKEFENKYIFII